MSAAPLIHIVDDEESVRRSLDFMLRTSGYTVRLWESGVAFLAGGELERGCILLDIRMPELDGLEVLRQLAQRGVTLPVIILTGHGEVNLAVEAMKNGAFDFLEKPCSPTILRETLQHAAAHLAASNDVMPRAAAAQALVDALEPQERDVLGALAQGHSNQQIVEVFGMSIFDVERNRANIMAKLGARSLPEAIRIAFAAGMGRRQS